MPDCNSCRDQRRDPVPYLVFESAQARNERTIKRLVTVIIVLALLVAGTVAGFLIYLSQYDFSGADISIDAADGHANYIGQNEDIRNGTYYGAETVADAEEQSAVERDGGT